MNDGTQTTGKAWERVLYVVARSLVRGFCRLYWRVEVIGLENVPASGGGIISPVHRSNIDTPLMAALTRRRIRFVGKESMWKFKPVGALFSALGSFPVKRDMADGAALRRCQEVLARGELLVVFPEGTRKEGPVVEELKDGAAYLATRGGVPIIPVGIGGSAAAMPRGAKWIKPVKILLVVGHALQPEPMEGNRVQRPALAKLTVELRSEIQRLYEEAQARVGRQP